MTAALALLAGTTLALAGAALLPRAGHPVVLALPAGAEGSAFGIPGWRVQGISPAGPLVLVLAAPDGTAADPFSLAHALGAWGVLAARPGNGCSPYPQGL